MLQPNAAPYDRGKARIISVICRRGPRDGSSAFIFDLMEPKRPETDRKVLEFIKAHVFDPADFIIRSDGVCRLNPEMARCVVGLIDARPPKST
jgi:CRISPR/Cas system-associated endonuclease Cas1